MITSTKNEQVKRLTRLCKSARARNEENVYLAEGIRLVSEIPEDELDTVFISESQYNRGKLRLPSDARTEIMDDRVFAHVADTETPQGVLAVARQKHYSFNTIIAGPAPLLLFVERIQNPGNLGTILRTAECAGASGVILSRDSADIYNPKTVRGSMGAVLRVPFYYTDDAAACARSMKEHGIRICAASLSGSGLYTEERYTEGTAFLIGNEGNGLSGELLAEADTRIRIPMAGKAESLNAAVAASLFIYEAFRQRAFAGADQKGNEI